MKSQSVILCLCALFAAACIGSCTASSELGEEDSAGQSVSQEQQSVQPDSTAATPQQTIPAVSATPAQTNKQGFTTQDDTIEVESAKRNHRSEHKPVTVQVRATPSTAAAYTVQIGAFKAEANAVRACDAFSRRYKRSAITASSVFDASLKLYRVTAGGFATQQEAERFVASLKKKFPREYKRAWVVRKTE
ncbi:MAG TPA: SPOR domain-containing protein [Bacteroidota bacterium]|nr:SPOR domain-containing protein [Bacteroidota bacterium]